MDALLLPLGSSGDVLPFCALGRALQARGHRVRVATNPYFATTVRRAGLAFLPIGRETDYLALVDDPAFMHRWRGFPRLMRYVAEQIAPVHALVAAAGRALAVAHPLAFGARIAAHERGLRLATAVLSPAFFHSAHEPPVLAGLPLGHRLPRVGRQALGWAVDRLLGDGLVGPTLNRFRAGRGLAPVRRLFRQGWHDDELFLALFPDWFAAPQPDWPRRVAVGGFPRYDGAEASLAPGLAAWLGDGAPPLVFTAGTAYRHAHQFFCVAVAAAARLGRRALLLTRFADQLPERLPPHVRHAGYVPLGRVLRQAAALVHHGGIGTAAAALAAGVPQLVMPLAHDQLDNGARLQRLGVGDVLGPERFDAARVARRLRGLLGSAAVAGRCRALAGRLDAARPLDAAVTALEAYAGAPTLQAMDGAA